MPERSAPARPPDGGIAARRVGHGLLSGRWLAGLGALVALALFVNASSGAAAVEYVVQPGDTLGALALRYGVTVEELAEINYISNPNLIYVGATLRIPDSGGEEGTTPATVPPATTPPAVTVQPTTTTLATTVTPPPPPPIPEPGSSATTVPPATTTTTTLTPESVPTTTTTAPPETQPTVPPTSAPPPSEQDGDAEEPDSEESPEEDADEEPNDEAGDTDADNTDEDDDSDLPEGVVSVVTWVPYTIRPGDWLSSIAQRYDTTVEELARVNVLTNTDLIHVGQIILVPTSRTDGETEEEGPRAGMTVEQRLDYWANYYNVPPELLKALTWWESGWNNNAISSVGAIGIGQLIPSTVDFVADVLIGADLNPHIVDDNIRMSARFVRYLLDETGNDRRLTLAAYYQGLYAVRKYGIYKVSIPYVNGILALQDKYRR